jgi:O-antigen/teichoic acid export membrane protein
LKGTIKKITREENFLSLAGNLTIAFFGFAGFALIARSFPLDVFGQWVLFISSGTFIEMFRFGITNTALIRYLSGAPPDDRSKFIGSNGIIGLSATFLIALTLIVFQFIFTEPIKHAGYELFFTWYPLLAFLNLPFNNALVILQADSRFGKILIVRLINSGGFFLILLVNFLFLKMSVLQLLLCMLGMNAVTSIFCIYKGWDGLRNLFLATKETTRTLLDFGKYTTFTLIGTNLLRSADTLIISLSPMGPAAVALYSIPMKLTELQQIPLRSFAATAFPKMSKASMQGRKEDVRSIFYSYSGAITYLFILISVITFSFAGLFVLILGGHQYVGTDPVTGANTASIVRVFSLYGLLLPIDRMTGVGLDSINKPGKNLIKVIFMVLANIAGDLIAVFLFKSLLAVAVASVIFTLLGVMIGMYFLDKELKIDHLKIFSAGKQFYIDSYATVRRLISEFK